jgi:hypothetical protein
VPQMYSAQSDLAPAPAAASGALRRPFWPLIPTLFSSFRLLLYMFLRNLGALTVFQDCLSVPDAQSPDITVTEGFSAVSGSQLIGPRSGLMSRLSALTRRSGNVEEMWCESRFLPIAWTRGCRSVYRKDVEVDYC